MRFAGAPALLVLAASLRLMDCKATCQMVNKNDHVEGECPIKLTSVQVKDGGRSPKVTLRVWLKAVDFFKYPIIEILLQYKKEVLRPIQKKKHKGGNKGRGDEILVRCSSRGVTQTLTHGNTSLALWELVYGFVDEDASQVSVTYSTNSSNCSVTYSVPRRSWPTTSLKKNVSGRDTNLKSVGRRQVFTQEARPDFTLSVNKSSKTIGVIVESEDEVFVRWCYKVNDVQCNEVDTPQKKSRSALLNIHYLLPCICVQVYYTYTDALRHQKCPFQNKSLIDVRDILRSSEVNLYESYIHWRYECPATNLNISASLCWKQQEHLCIPVLNSTLEKQNGSTLNFNTLAVDKHPQICVQFNVQGSHDIKCLFQADMSSWEMYIGPGRQSISVFLSSSASAQFSAQLCVLAEQGCTPRGPVLSVAMEGNDIEKRINVPVHNLTEKPCVQVWQSDPYLNGRRILCPDYMNNREGLYAAAALMFVVVVTLLGFFFHRFIKSVTSGWLIIHKPLLLVCSSDQSSHISSVCALALILQRELGATVHTSLWAQSSQRQAGNGAGVADLGPLPWLYGQWDAVCKAQGKVLIIWSTEAKKSYENWRKVRANMSKNEEKMEHCRKQDLKLNGRKLGKCRKEKVVGEKGFVELCDNNDWHSEKEPSTVIESVFVAALASLEAAVQECRSQGVAIVYFQGLCHSKDIPKTLRAVSRYCLPQDFSGLIQELGQLRRRTKNGEFRWHCWPRLVSKGLSVWLARKLAQRLQTLLPQKQAHKPHGLSVKGASDRTQSRLKLPVAAELGSLQEQELLQGSSWRAEKP